MVIGDDPHLRKPRVFYGWWIVGVSLLCLFVYSGGLYSVGPFYKPLETGFGWSRFQVAPAALYFGSVALTGPLVGRLTDRYGARRVLLGGALLGGLGYALLSLLQTLWQFYTFYLIAYIGLSVMGVVPAGTLVANWFQRRRGLAMGITITGIGLGGFYSPLASSLISTFDWRQTYLALGLLTWILILPTVALVIRTRPEEKGLLPYGETQPTALSSQAPESEGEGWTLPTASKTLTFWLISAAFLVGFFASIGMLGHVHPYFAGLGVTEATAAAVFGFTGNMGILGKLSSGYLSDRMPVRYVTALFFALQAAAVFLLITVTGTTAVMWVFAVLFGAGMGAGPTLLPLLVVHRFGRTSFAPIFGAIVFLGYSGAATGPLASGYIYTATGSYHWFLIISLLLFAVAIACILSAWFSRRPRPYEVPAAGTEQ